MKSFQHFYKDIKIERADPVPGISRADRLKTMDFVILGPKTWPPQVVAWFGRRLLKKLYGIKFEKQDSSLTV